MFQEPYSLSRKNSVQNLSQFGDREKYTNCSIIDSINLGELYSQQTQKYGTIDLSDDPNTTEKIARYAFLNQDLGIQFKVKVPEMSVMEKQKVLKLLDFQVIIRGTIDTTLQAMSGSFLRYCILPKHWVLQLNNSTANFNSDGMNTSNIAIISPYMLIFPNFAKYNLINCPNPIEIQGQNQFLDFNLIPIYPDEFYDNNYNNTLYQNNYFNFVDFYGKKWQSYVPNLKKTDISAVFHFDVDIYS